MRGRVRDAADFGPRRSLTGTPLPALLPDTARALAAGQIGIEHARAISDLFEHIPAQDETTQQLIEAAALEAATVCSPHRLRQWCVQAAARLDQDGPEPADTAQQRERSLMLIDRPDGTTKLTGRLTPYAAAALRAVLGPLSAPAPAEDGTRDERTASQRRHDGLADACTRLLRAGTLPDSAGAATTILATIDYRDLLHRYWTSLSSSDCSDSDGAQRAGGYAVISYGSLIPVQELLRRAGEAAIIPVVLSDTGGILAYGRTLPRKRGDPQARLPRPTPRPHRARRRLRPTRLHHSRRLVRTPPRHPLAARRRHRHRQPCAALPARPPPTRPRRHPHHDQRRAALDRTQLP